MADMVVIGGQAVDVSDPCALWSALYAAKIKMLAGEHVEEVQLKSPVTQRIVKLTPANMATLDSEMLRLRTACDLKNGKRTRFAKTIGYV